MFLSIERLFRPPPLENVTDFVLRFKNKAKMLVKVQKVCTARKKIFVLQK